MTEAFSESLQELEPIVLALVGQAGLCGHSYLHPIPGGANNRVFRVEVNGAQALLKIYFHSRKDSRDRLGAEFKFSSFAWKNGVHTLPKPLACDVPHRLGLYEFVVGRKITPSEIVEARVKEALYFYQEINGHKHLPEAQELPIASEACFTLHEHLHLVERRLDNLRKIDKSSALNLEAAKFIHEELSTAWVNITARVRQRARELGLSLDQAIPLQERCISPSDFGFHNALLKDDAHLRFIDFEYAGWDDPAKLVCDFFCQPALPVPMDFWEMFATAVAANLTAPERQMQRFALLLPVYRLKWCCILLNEFLPVGQERRLFASDGVDKRETEVQQLQKARNALQLIIENGVN
jgi:hypothetical protein